MNRIVLTGIVIFSLCVVVVIPTTRFVLTNILWTPLRWYFSITTPVERGRSEPDDRELIRVTAARLAQENAELRDSLRAYENLKISLDTYQKYAYKVVPAVVGLFEPGPIASTYQRRLVHINGGEKIPAGSLVVLGKSVIGRTGEMSINGVVPIISINNPEFRLVVHIVAETSPQGIIETTTLGAARVRFLPADVNLTAGSPLITSGSEPGIPSGIPVGLLKRTYQEDGTLFQSAEFTSFADFSDQLLVAILVEL